MYDEVYYNYHLDGVDFLITDETKPDYKDVEKILKTRNKILYANLKVLDVEYDITHDMRKFVYYYGSNDNSNDHKVPWIAVLDYCFRNYEGEDDIVLDDTNSELTLTFNDDDMTEVSLKPTELDGKYFNLNDSWIKKS